MNYATELKALPLTAPEDDANKKYLDNLKRDYSIKKALIDMAHKLNDLHKEINTRTGGIDL